MRRQIISDDESVGASLAVFNKVGGNGAHMYLSRHVLVR